MKVRELELPGVLLVEPRIHADARGSFLESWSERRYAEAGIAQHFVQDNISRSRRGVIRGLHYQHPAGQAKLTSVLHGEVWDVVVDVRRGSPSFGRWVGVTLSGESGRQLFIPEGFAHGFAVLSEEAVFSYKCGRYYDPATEWTLRWDDPALGIEWPVREPILSDKDRQGVLLAELPADALPPMPAGAQVLELTEQPGG
jgi:dTDP-4-dehydrorhamnose 3,5-epimerase